MLGYYLADLIEGDGSIIVSKTHRNEKGKFIKKKKTVSRTQKFSTSLRHNYNKLDPNWVTGFSDAEACFSVEISKSETYKEGWRVRPIFSIGLHSKDLELIKKIQSFFNGKGKIYHEENSKVVSFRITSIKDLAQLVLPHFDKYPLFTQKQADFLLFKQVVGLVLRKEHLTMKGLLEIISIKASLNLGLPDVLKKAFPNVIHKDRPAVEYKGIINPSLRDPHYHDNVGHWLVGFADGESCFFI
jgi:hypothetical protein